MNARTRRRGGLPSSPDSLRLLGMRTIYNPRILKSNYDASTALENRGGSDVLSSTLICQNGREKYILYSPGYSCGFQGSDTVPLMLNCKNIASYIFRIHGNMYGHYVFLEEE